MLQNDTAVFHAFAWNPVKAEYDDWRGRERERQLPRAASKLKGPCIIVRRNGSRKDGLISQKVANPEAGETAT